MVKIASPFTYMSPSSVLTEVLNILRERGAMQNPEAGRRNDEEFGDQTVETTFGGVRLQNTNEKDLVAAERYHIDDRSIDDIARMYPDKTTEQVKKILDNLLGLDVALHASPKTKEFIYNYLGNEREPVPETPRVIRRQRRIEAFNKLLV